MQEIRKYGAGLRSIGPGLQVIHVFGKVFGDMRFQDFEDATLARPGSGFRQVKRTTALTLASESMFGAISTAKFLTCGPRFFSIMARISSGLTSRIPFSSLASARRRAGRRCWFRAMTWPSFCRPGTLAMSRSRRTSAVSRREVDLLQKFWGEARWGEMRHDEHHGVAHRWAPLQVSFRNQCVYGDDLVDDPARHGVAQG